MSQAIAQPAEITPKRLRKLMLRLAQLQPGMAYTITLVVLDNESDPVQIVTPLGKVENGHRQERADGVR